MQLFQIIQSVVPMVHGRFGVVQKVTPMMHGRFEVVQSNRLFDIKDGFILLQTVEQTHEALQIKRTRN